MPLFSTAASFRRRQGRSVARAGGQALALEVDRTSKRNQYRTCPSSALALRRGRASAASLSRPPSKSRMSGSRSSKRRWQPSAVQCTSPATCHRGSKRFEPCTPPATCHRGSKRFEPCTPPAVRHRGSKRFEPPWWTTAPLLSRATRPRSGSRRSLQPTSGCCRRNRQTSRLSAAPPSSPCRVTASMAARGPTQSHATSSTVT
mmetsp:Transcript_6625/g.19627  ORF Transcript_6625/g.19627 Transcript_6625/m.19627 type:complete len:203 (-) Transcript_6625:2569-3177(-)